MMGTKIGIAERRALYSWPKKLTTWTMGETLCISVPFTWLMDEAHRIAKSYDGPVMIGGPGTMMKTEIEGISPVEISNPYATFTTRGCVNSCAFCAVPKIEGEFREISDFRPAPIICDNNLLASSKSHLVKVVDRLKSFPFVDFNQGLEAKRFTPEVADLLGNLDCKVRFAFDWSTQEAIVKDAIDLCRKRTTKLINVYVLFGFLDSPDDALYRLEKVRSWGIFPNAMRFQPLNAKKKNEYVAPGWSDELLKKISRYYNRLSYLNGIPFADYDWRAYAKRKTMKILEERMRHEKR
jgi:hypothetical protein